MEREVVTEMTENAAEEQIADREILAELRELRAELADLRAERAPR